MTVICFFAIIISQTGSNRVNFLFGSFIRKVSNPVYEVYQSVTGTVSDIWSSYIFLVDLKAENIDLQNQIKRLTEKDFYYKELETQYKHITKDLEFSTANDFDTVYAEIIFNIPKEYSQLLIINKGLDDGIEKDDGIITPDGAVGRIIAVNSSSSTIQIITDARSHYPVIIQRTREKVMLSGTPEGTLKLYFVPRELDLRDGDVVITSGLTGIFPKGIKIGEITEIVKKDFGLFQETKVKPSVDFLQLENVFVTKSPNKNLISHYKDNINEGK